MVCVIVVVMAMAVSVRMGAVVMFLNARTNLSGVAFERVAAKQEKTFDVDEQRTIDWRAGGFQHTGDPELFIVDVAVFGGVGRLERVADAHVILPRNGRADDAGEEIILREIFAGCERDVVQTPEHLRRRSHDAERAIVIARVAGDRLFDPRREFAVLLVASARGREELLVVRPGDVLDRPSEVVDGIEHELVLAPLFADDEVVAQPGAVRK